MLSLVGLGNNVQDGNLSTVHERDSKTRDAENIPLIMPSAIGQDCSVLAPEL